MLYTQLHVHVDRYCDDKFAAQCNNYDPIRHRVVLSYHKVRDGTTMPQSIKQRTAGPRTAGPRQRRARAEAGPGRGDHGWVATGLGQGQAYCPLNEPPDPGEQQR